VGHLACSVSSSFVCLACFVGKRLLRNPKTRLRRGGCIALLKRFVRNACGPPFPLRKTLSRLRLATIARAQHMNRNSLRAGHLQPSPSMPVDGAEPPSAREGANIGRQSRNYFCQGVEESPRRSFHLDSRATPILRERNSRVYPASSPLQ
jgi:hypothetical protein